MDPKPPNFRAPPAHLEGVLLLEMDPKPKNFGAASSDESIEGSSAPQARKFWDISHVLVRKSFSFRANIAKFSAAGGGQRPKTPKITQIQDF